MDDTDRIICAIWAAAMCAGKDSEHGEYFKAYDYFMAMVKGREEAAQRSHQPGMVKPRLRSDRR